MENRKNRKQNRDVQSLKIVRKIKSAQKCRLFYYVEQKVTFTLQLGDF